MRKGKGNDRSCVCVSVASTVHLLFNQSTNPSKPVEYVMSFIFDLQQYQPMIIIIK
jgi:hypothetical protein